MNSAILLGLLGAVFNTANDLIYRISSAGVSKKKVLSFYLTSAFSSVLISLVFNFILYGNLVFTNNEIFYGIILGVLSLITYVLFIFSFSGTNTSVSVIIFRLNMVPGIILAILLLNETISIRRASGILLCIASIFMLTKRESKKSEGRNYVIFSIGACIFGGMLNFLNKVAVNQGCLPFRLLFWRFLTVLLICGIYVFAKKQWQFSKKSTKYAFVSGFLLILAADRNLLFQIQPIS
jgi:drug/metabolite transporter (DMT)-like permease